LKIEKNSKKKLTQAVVKIQSTWRGHFIRRTGILEQLYLEKEKKEAAARLIQASWREFLYGYDDLESLFPENEVPRPHSPQHKFDKKLTKKQMDKLGIEEFDHIPKISQKSRKLAEKRRQQMGLGDLTVEEALIQENRINATFKEKKQLEEHIKENTKSKSLKKATKQQADHFYNRQKKFRDKVNNKIAIQRVSNQEKENSFIGRPSINKSSKNLNRSYKDLMQWRNNADIKLTRQRHEREKEELVSLKTYRSSISSNC
jgi:hypothetical protein